MGLFKIGKGLVKAVSGFAVGDPVLIVKGAKDVEIGILTSIVGGGIKDLLDGTGVGDIIDSADILS